MNCFLEPVNEAELRAFLSHHKTTLKDPVIYSFRYFFALNLWKLSLLSSYSSSKILGLKLCPRSDLVPQNDTTVQSILVLIFLIMVTILNFTLQTLFISLLAAKPWEKMNCMFRCSHVSWKRRCHNYGTPCIYIYIYTFKSIWLRPGNFPHTHYRTRW